MRLHLFAFGKLKTPGLREAADYYTRNLRPWAPLEEHELKPVPVPDKNDAMRSRIQEKEGRILLDRLEGAIGARGIFYLLDEKGLARPTREWAELAHGWEGLGASAAVGLCIGSSLGFSDEVRSRARGLLSLGPQTFPHELARVALLEQLYRALSVVRGHPYHNEG